MSKPKSAMTCWLIAVAGLILIAAICVTAFDSKPRRPDVQISLQGYQSDGANRLAKITLKNEDRRTIAILPGFNLHLMTKDGSRTTLERAREKMLFLEQGEVMEIDTMIPPCRKWSVSFPMMVAGRTRTEALMGYIKETIGRDVTSAGLHGVQSPEWELEQP
jgi:hypothetical protein